MTTYLLIDLANTYFRARHSAHRGTTTEERVAFAIHVTLSSVNRCWRDRQAQHAVFLNEGRSWRKDFYPPYKRNRTEQRAAMSSKDAAEDQAFWTGLDQLKLFLTEHTNCTVLRHPELEADDLIAGFIDLHPNDDHIIISTDSDFHQLLSENTQQYNGITDELHTIHGIKDRKNRLVVDKKTQQPKKPPEPAWLLFEKCMRGDSSDNVFSACPGVRLKGTKNRVGLLEAYADRHKKGYAWNNLMLSRWLDADGQEHRVLDDYQRNQQLIDLRAQPPIIKQKITHTVTQGCVPPNSPQIGSHFLRFCGRFDLQKLSEQSQNYAEIFTAAYTA